MNLIIKIAWRNIQRHRGKSLIIGTILFIGALLMAVGNGVISGMNRGLQKNIVEGFTGDIILVSDNQESDNVFMEFLGKAIEPISNYRQIDSALKTVPLVEKWLPIGKNFAMALNEDGGLADGVFVLGVNMKQYRDFFNENIKIVEGRMLRDNETGVLVPTGWRKQFAEYYNIIFSPEGAMLDTASLGKDVIAYLSNMSIKNSVIYMGMSADNSTTDIRVPVRGIVKYRSLNMIWGQFPIVDIESYRECMGYFSALAQTAELKEETATLLGKSEESLDEMFSEDNMIVSSSTTEAPVELAEGSLRVEKAAKWKNVDLDAGIFNMILVRLSDGQQLDKAAADLTKILEEKNLGVRAVTWKKGTGMIGSMAMLIKGSLFVFVMLLFFVAIIIIVNTLSMAAIERTSEIGMMRAVGARKGFIRTMFLGETAMLSAVFGGIGIAAGIVIINIISLLNITTDNDMLQLLYGGDTFRPYMSLLDITLVVVQLGIVTLIAVAYPIRVASSITPLDAVSRE
ncbi:MAG: FtsX-like permease family protein [Chitinispirillaceae bacterium]|nr:FtsX-like permease family protein [Chitinispirillaceae bacterium]